MSDESPRAIDAGGVLALDASVCINLLGSADALGILAALRPRRCVVAQAAFREVTKDPFNSAAPGPPLGTLVENGYLVIEAPHALEVATALELVGAKEPDDLDDGEAATISYAHHRRATIVIDERKGRRICRARFPALPVISTVDLYALPEVVKSIGTERLANALYSSLRTARMRVPPEREAWVRSLLSPDLLASCPSLPRRMREPES